MKKIIQLILFASLIMIPTSALTKSQNIDVQNNSTTETDSIAIKLNTLQKKLAIAKRKDSWNNQIKYLKDISKIYSLNDDIPEALKFILEAIQIAGNNEINNTKAGLYHRASEYLQKIEAYKEAIEYLIKQAKWNKINNNSRDEYNSITSIGLLYYKINNKNKSREYFQKALLIADKMANQHYQAHSSNNIGLTYLKVQSFDTAKIHFKRALTLFENNPNSSVLDSLMIGIVSGNLAECFFNKKDKNTAIRLLNTDIAFCKKYKSYNNLASAYLKLVRLHMMFGSFNKAKYNNILSQTVLNSSPNTLLQLTTYKNFISIYMKSEEIEKADDFIKKYIQLNNSLYGPKTIQQITETKSVFQLDKINYELLLNQALLDKKKEEINQLKQGEKILRLKIYIAIGASLMFLSLGFFGYLKLKSDQAKKAEIQKIKNQLIKAELKNKKNENIQLKGNLETKNIELVNYAIEITESYKFTEKLRDELKELKKDGKGDTREYIKLLQQVNSQLGIENQLKEFQRKASILHENFNEKLINVNSKLTKNDFYLCSLIRLELSNKDIAILRNVTEKAIRMSKYRLKQKLQLPKETDLGDFLKQL
ncbi:MAG: hypothetical protein HRT69_07205 [Flavobacteriaceae bacterium]|nr:hypothetical protein [Flavobacteriaceae bacterium]